MIDKPLWQIALEHSILVLQDNILALKHDVLVLQSVIDNDGEWVDPKPAYDKYVVNTWFGLNVRDAPKTSSPKIASLLYNQIVEIQEISGGWGKLEVEGITGWSFMNYLRKIG